MSWDWYAIEQDVHRRHADDLRRAARARLAHEARLAARAIQGAGRARRFLDRLGGWLITWGSRLQARAAPTATLASATAVPRAR
jgi:hypothetical protein